MNGHPRALELPIFGPELTSAVIKEKDVVYKTLGLASPPIPTLAYHSHAEKDIFEIDWCHENGFWANSYGPRVALASFAGSGNTWMRYLLQQSSGKILL